MQDDISPRLDISVAPNATSLVQTNPAGVVNDPLLKASTAVELAIQQTATNPSSRAAQIATIKSAYQQEKYGAR